MEYVYWFCIGFVVALIINKLIFRFIKEKGVIHIFEKDDKIEMLLEIDCSIESMMNSKSVIFSVDNKLDS